MTTHAGSKRPEVLAADGQRETDSIIDDVKTSNIKPCQAAMGVVNLVSIMIQGIQGKEFFFVINTFYCFSDCQDEYRFILSNFIVFTIHTEIYINTNTEMQIQVYQIN